MPKSGPNTLRFVPTEQCARCGDDTDPDRFAVAFVDDTKDGEEGTAESGNLCADCFDELSDEFTA